jgi:hypothetical protein
MPPEPVTGPWPASGSFGNPSLNWIFLNIPLLNNILTDLRQGAAGTRVASPPYMESGIARDLKPIDLKPIRSCA